MAIFESLLKNLEPYMEIIYFMLTIIIAFTIFSIILKIIKIHLLKKIKKKIQKQMEKIKREEASLHNIILELGEKCD